MAVVVVTGRSCRGSVAGHGSRVIGRNVPRSVTELGGGGLSEAARSGGRGLWARTVWPVVVALAELPGGIEGFDAETVGRPAGETGVRIGQSGRAAGLGRTLIDVVARHTDVVG